MSDTDIELDFRPGTLDRWYSAALKVGVSEMLGNARSMAVIVPHADDETLGCGGLIAIATELEIEVTVHVLTDGGASHPRSVEWPSERVRHQRELELRDAVDILSGAKASVHCHGFPDGWLSSDALVNGWVETPQLIVTCWKDDPHPDHRACFAIARAAADCCGARLLAFPLWVLTTKIAVPEHHRILCLDVSEQLGRKRAAIACHRSQLGQLILDDPQGFVLDENLLSLFVRPDELYVEINSENE